MPRLRIAAYVLAVGLIFVIPSSAASVTISVTSPNVVTYRGAISEANGLDVNRGLIFTDSLATLNAGGGCVQVGTSSADCSSAIAGGHGYTVNADLRDNNDTANVVVDGVANIQAGNGDDTVRADSFGQYTTVYGQGGNDDIAAGGEGGQIADGGPGDDIVYAGGFAGDSFGFGGTGSDTIYFQQGLPVGATTLDGGDGNDTIVAHAAGAPSTATGGDGNDIIVIDGPPTRLNAFFTVDAGAGDDTVIGGPLADTINGGDGRDFIDVRGGGADTVTCGPGNDVVRYDASDTIAADCEITIPG